MKILFFVKNAVIFYGAVSMPQQKAIVKKKKEVNTLSDMNVILSCTAFHFHQSVAVVLP